MLVMQQAGTVTLYRAGEESEDRQEAERSVELVKLIRAQGGCLGTKSRRRTR